MKSATRRTLRAVSAVVAASTLCLTVAAPAHAGNSTVTGPKKSGTSTSTWRGSFSGTGSLDPALPCSPSFCSAQTLTIKAPGSYWAKHTGKLDISIAWSGVYNDLDLYVYDATGKQVANSGEAFTESESLSIAAPKPGKYIVQVRSYLALPSTAYTAKAVLTSKAK